MILRRYRHHLTFDLLADHPLGSEEVVGRLQVHPELGVGSEKTTEAQRIVRRQAAAALPQFVYPWLCQP